MESNLIAAYKALFAVRNDPNVGQLAPTAEQARAGIDGMLSAIKGALVTLAHRRADAEVEEALK